MPDIASIAKEYGFRELYLFPNEPFLYYERRLMDGALHKNGQKIVYDPQIRFPWANALALAIFPYHPLKRDALLSGCYIASNTSYHAMKALMAGLDERGIQTENAYLPLRELMLRSGLGVELLNGLTAIEPYGSRFIAQSFVLRLDEPAYFLPREKKRCAGFEGKCDACKKACPAGAITCQGMDFRRCARAYMDGETMTRETMDAMTSMIGCEICQHACPYNAAMTGQEDTPQAFALERLLAGEWKDALDLIGVNQKKNGKLYQHACVIAVKQGRSDLLPLMRPLLEDEREAVRAAAAYAIEALVD